MTIGPGMAPQASLYAPEGLRLRRARPTWSIPALDWALDPNGDGDFSDHLDIVNMSLGADYGAADDPENAVVDDARQARRAARSFAAGNAGDSPTSAARRATRSAR